MYFPDRFREACRIRQIFGKDVAAKMDISPNTVSGYMTGRNSPDLAFLELFCESYSINLAWLSAGYGQPTGSVDKVEPDNADVIMVPRYDVRASAGKGATILDEEPIGHMAFQRDWIERMELEPKFLFVIGVDGDSMVPSLQDGDSILVDRNISDVHSGAAYVFRQDDELLVKYLQRMPGNMLRVSSENQNYPSYDIDMTVHADNVQVIGRVACSMHSWL